jgi:hypothetical protein
MPHPGETWIHFKYRNIKINKKLTGCNSGTTAGISLQDNESHSCFLIELPVSSLDNIRFLFRRYGYACFNYVEVTPEPFCYNAPVRLFP